MTKKVIKSYTEEESIYYDIEARFIYDYSYFSNNLRVLEASAINHKIYKCNKMGKECI